jgi:pimeloyl-ACP methyl ester carboxylesterase
VAANGAAERGYRDLFVTSTEGLRLYARDYRPAAAGGHALPVVCLPGLARTSADFHELALALSSDPSRPRRVLALDYRGRGRSDRDPNWRNYDVRVEYGDVLQVLTVAGVHEAVLVGTSRGGLITMALGAARPSLLKGVVLNDIGPVVEPKGLLRIKSYVGRLPQPRSLAEAGDLLKRISDAQFPKLGDAEWQELAKGTWTETPDGLALAYDPALLKTLDALDLEAPLPQLWFLFEGLKGVPLLALRGANSDILSAETLAAMQARHPDAETLTVPDQGHAPLLSGPAALDPIRRLIERAKDGERKPSPR